MATRTIQSPGVQINETDLSTRTNPSVGTSVLVTGFAPQGPSDEVINITSVAEFEQVYGLPTNAAERYMYHTARQILQSNATTYVSRMPYGDDAGTGFSSQYSALVYPVLPIPSASLSATYTPTVVAQSGYSLSSANIYMIGEPTLVTLSEANYYTIVQGNMNWSNTAGLSSTAFAQDNLSTYASAGIIVVNSAKTTIDEKFQGYYFNLADNANLNPATGYTAIQSVKAVSSTANTWVTVPNSRLGFSLTATSTTPGSISEVVEEIPSFTISGPSFKDTLIGSVFRLRPSPFGTDVNTLQNVLTEGYFGSLNAGRKIQSQTGGAPVTFALSDLILNSNNITMVVNPNIANTVWTDANDLPVKAVRIYGQNVFADIPTDEQYAQAYTSQTQTALWFKMADNAYTFSVYAPTNAGSTTKSIGSIPTKLDRVLRLVENPDVYPLDLTVDGGLSTIWATVQKNDPTNKIYRDDKTVDISELYVTTGDPVSGTATDAWAAVVNRFVAFAQDERKDHLFIADPLRSIFVQGENGKVMDDKTKIYSTHIYWALRNLYGAQNTSYACSYANWFKTFDNNLSKSFWVPSSGYVCAAMVRTDINFQPWYAPAGFTRGLVSGVTDVGINPTQKQRDLLYKIALNPIAFFPNDGFAIYGQKTLQRKPSAFDRINVRRLFLWLEKSTLNTVKYFVFEPNTFSTRTRLVNTITPLFELAKNTEGLYDYMIVADERINTPDVIDANELKVNIYIKPVRTAEFIMVEFFATKTSQNFSELI